MDPTILPAGAVSIISWKAGSAKRTPYTPTQPFPAPPSVLFDIEQQRTHIVVLAKFFLAHPTHMAGLVQFARRIARARKTLANALVEVVRTI